jgi:hypothetical protein
MTATANAQRTGRSESLSRNAGDDARPASGLSQRTAVRPL